jgi:hypothetical protein
MYKLIEWSPDLDLTEFYSEAGRRGFVNNSSQKNMIECFFNEREWNAWILYNEDRAVGSVAAHSFDDVIPGGYRILTRVCTFAEERKGKGLITIKRLIEEHQNLTDQFLLPQCIEWVAERGRIFATSNASKEASQRLVHSYYFPTLERLKIATKIKDVHYRKTDQTVWEIFPDKFYEELNKYERWENES